MGYVSWSVVFGEQPSAAKWNILGTNDASFNDGTGFPNGVCLQEVGNTTGAVATGTTVMPYDDTIPQITEGDQYLTQAITPKATTNILEISVSIWGTNSAASGDLSVALFQDATANALAATAAFLESTAVRRNITLQHRMLAGTTSSTTFRVRAGGSAAGTTTINGNGGLRRFGGVGATSIFIREFKA